MEAVYCLQHNAMTQPTTVGGALQVFSPSTFATLHSDLTIRGSLDIIDTYRNGRHVGRGSHKISIRGKPPRSYIMYELNLTTYTVTIVLYI